MHSSDKTRVKDPTMSLLNIDFKSFKYVDSGASYFWYVCSSVEALDCLKDLAANAEEAKKKKKEDAEKEKQKALENIDDKFSNYAKELDYNSDDGFSKSNEQDALENHRLQSHSESPNE